MLVEPPGRPGAGLPAGVAPAAAAGGFDDEHIARRHLDRADVAERLDAPIRALDPVDPGRTGRVPRSSLTWSARIRVRDNGRELPRGILAWARRVVVDDRTRESPAAVAERSIAGAQGAHAPRSSPTWSARVHVRDNGPEPTSWDPGVDPGPGSAPTSCHCMGDRFGERGAEPMAN